MHRASATFAGVFLWWGTFLALQLRAEEPEKIPIENERVPGIRRVCDVGGDPEGWGSSEYGYPYANRTIAISPDGRWLAFPFVESVDIVKKPAEEAGVITGDWWVNLCDLTAPPGSECPRWRQGQLGIHSPVVAGPNNTVAFLSDDPLQRHTHERLARLWALEDKERADAAQVPPGVKLGPNIFDQEGEDAEKLPPEYIRVCWCGTGTSAYYRLPAGSLDDPRPKSRSRLLDLWFTENPVTKKPSLFALLFDGTLCFWPLQDNGFPPAVNTLMVNDKPETLNVSNLAIPKTARPEEFVRRLFAVAHASNRIALHDPDRPPVRVLSLRSGKIQTLEMKNLGDGPYQDLLLSENGRCCVAVRPSKRPAKLPNHPNVMEAWNAETGELLWQRTLRDRFFVSRAAFSPDSSRLATWSRVKRDLKRELQPADVLTDWEEHFQAGVLQLWDATSGAPVGTLPFPAKLWIQALAFTPDGKQVVVLEHGGACSLVETLAFRPAK